MPDPLVQQPRGPASGAPPGLLAPLARFADRLADLSVVGSFSRIGYLLRKGSWDPADLAVDMTGKVCLITGANSGIGAATAQGLAERGATVILACRNRERGKAALRRIEAATGSSRLALELVDLAEQTSVRALADRVRERYDRLHVLINNAGGMEPIRRETTDGIERNFATNVLGHVLLTNLLAPLLIRSAPARVVHVTSGGMYTQRLVVHDLQSKLLQPFNGLVVYAQNKRAQVELSEWYAEKLAHVGVTSNAMHPGWADTPVVATSLPRFRAILRPILRTWEEGADTLLWLAVAPRLSEVTGQFFFDRVPRGTHVFPGTHLTETDRRFLWQECVRLCGTDLDGLEPHRALLSGEQPSPQP